MGEAREKIAVLSSTLSLHEAKLKNPRENLDYRKRKKKMRTAKSTGDSKPIYGLDGVDERSMNQSADNERQSSRRKRHKRSGPVESRSWLSDDEMSQISSSWRGSAPGSANESYGPYESSTQRPHGNINPMPPPPPPRMFAPGLAIRKPKVDPYDPQSRLAPKVEYTFMRERQDAEVRGAWTAIDPDTGARLWDKRHHAEVAEREQARSEGRLASRASSVRPAPWSGSGSPNKDPAELGDTGSIIPDSISTTSRTVDPRFENLGLDIDPEVRERFIGIHDILREEQKPLSAFEQRNNLLYNASAPVNVIIGGEVVKTMIPKVDTRGELRDRHGDYIDGINRGLMKKRLEEDRKRRIGERDYQLQQATKERRAWMALTPEERERQLKKSQRNTALVALLGAGVQKTADAEDLYNWDAIPVSRPD